MFIHITACMLAKFPKEPSTPKASAALLPSRLLQLLPVGTKVTGRDSHPLKDSALTRRTLRFANPTYDFAQAAAWTVSPTTFIRTPARP